MFSPVRYFIQCAVCKRAKSAGEVSFLSRSPVCRGCVDLMAPTIRKRRAVAASLTFQQYRNRRTFS